MRVSHTFSVLREALLLSILAAFRSLKPGQKSLRLSKNPYSCAAMNGTPKNADRKQKPNSVAEVILYRQQCVSKIRQSVKTV